MEVLITMTTYMIFWSVHRDCWCPVVSEADDVVCMG